MPHRLPLTQMAALIQSGELSPAELLEAHLRQIEKENPRINAFVTMAEQDHDLPEGPLHGIPITIKDSFDVEGLATRCGSLLTPATPAVRDAAAVARLRAAGAVILGKTNCPDFLSSYETDNFLTGRTNNPWDVERTPGGSSGGEAAAIAACCSAGGLGSDGGGSIRVPAHFCGIAGLKPTPGRVPMTGHIPQPHEASASLGVAGPMARTAADLRLLFQVLAGAVRAPDLTGLRIGCMEQFLKVPVQPAVRNATRKAAAALQSMGFPVEPFAPRGLERAPNLWWFLFGELTVPAERSGMHWTRTEFLPPASKPAPAPAQIAEKLAARDAMRDALLQQMEDYPVLLLPPCGIPAFRHRERRFDTPEKLIGLFEAMIPATWVNLLGLPAAVIPFDHTGDGLPVGIQLVGRPGEDELLLELAVRLTLR